MKKIEKILIANRGEIACRIIRTCRRLGISTVAVYSDIDSDGIFVEMADEAVNIGPSGLESYLNADSIIEAAKRTGASAIHPGYGLLSENPGFVSKCLDAGITFIGPSPEAINAMGSKSEARELCEKIGVPVIPGLRINDEPAVELSAKAEEIGYPVMIKASAGGGGIGIFIVEKKEDFIEILESARRKSLAIFGDDSLLIEKYLSSVRHIEFQILADSHGNVIHCGERECSVQRRHQKMIEESPSPVMTDDLRKRMGESAAAVVRAVNYTNAGTVEFVLDDSGNYYFLEMNTRLQVEHPVTEEVTGLDLVELQIRIAEGNEIGISQEEIKITGHSIECRIYAEDPANNFNPSAGRILRWRTPEDVRVDSGFGELSEVSTSFDPMLAKVIVHSASRDEAVRKMIHSLNNTAVLGIATNTGFLADFINSEIFRAGDIKTDFFEKNGVPVPSKDIPEEEIRSLVSAAAIIKIHDDCSVDDESKWTGSFHPVQNISYQINDIDYSPDIIRTDQDRFRITLEGRESDITLFSITDESIALSVDGWRRKFIYAENEEKIYLQTPSTGHHTVRYLSRFQSMEFQHHKKESCEAPIDGVINVIKVSSGDSVEKGQVLIIMESMKMESPVFSDKTGTVREIFVKEGDFVRMGKILIDIAPENN